MESAHLDDLELPATLRCCSSREMSPNSSSEQITSTKGAYFSGARTHCLLAATDLRPEVMLWESSSSPVYAASSGVGRAR